MTQTTHAAVVPSTPSQIWTISKYEFKNFFGSRRFYILLLITILIGALLTVLVGYYRPDSFLKSGALTFYSNWWGRVVTFIVILSGIFFGGDAIASEFQNRTGYFLIPNPIRRSSVYVGKWIAAFTASMLVFTVFLAITIANGLYYFPSGVPVEFLESVAFSIVYLVAVMGFTFFFSSLFKTSSYSILVTAILLLFVFSFLEFLVSDLVKVEPWFILTYGAGIISNVMVVDPVTGKPAYPPHVVTQTFGPGGRISLTTYNVTIPEGLMILLGYFVITAVIGLILFERKDFT
ncbi:MAG TPA: ABC transporter permease [Conexivisphaerales archaeon]|nr:ABC transporter permease [Conexivisphaerales archaeon]